jgi:deoxyadenosine/deoxycytidine kinase
MDLTSLRHVAIEGPIGVGKTSLARRLAAALGADLLLEAPQENPYLARFYDDPRGFAFQAQLAFLFHRAQQVRRLSQTSMFAPQVVSDFMIDKDAMFARLTLDADEYRLYLPMYEHVASTVPAPDLVLWLRAPTPTLQERIARRGRAMERGIEDEYLDRLSAEYVRFFAGFGAAPVLPIDHVDFHPAADDRDFDRLLSMVEAFEPAMRTDAAVGRAPPTR